MKKEYLEAGRICSAHGVRGDLKIEHMCDSAAVLAKQKRIFILSRGEYIERAVRRASASGKFVLMSVEGVDTREDAIAMRGNTVYLHRSDVPLKRGAMLIVDMIGLPVIHAESGERLGTLSDVSDIAGRRIYTVATDSGEVLLPDVPEFIKEIDGELGIRVLPIPGFFDGDYEV